MCPPGERRAALRVTGPGGCAAALLLALLPAPVRAGQVACHVTYGGETHTLTAVYTAEPYTVAIRPIGSYFLFRIVAERIAGLPPVVKVYTYADREVAVPIHVAEYPWPLRTGGRFGFTGLQRVYEPVRDGELEYWCEARGPRGRS